MKALSEIPLILQPAGTAMCGAACVSMVLSYYNREAPGMDDIWYNISGTSPQGREYCKTSLIGQYLITNTVCPTIVRFIKLRELLEFCRDSKIPAIMNHYSFENSGLGHYTVFTGIDGDAVEIKDPENADRKKVGVNELINKFVKGPDGEITGNIVILTNEISDYPQKFISCPHCQGPVYAPLYDKVKEPGLVESLLCPSCDEFTGY